MENISYIGLSQQMALQQQMEMTANNLANMNTPGYKAKSALFSEYINKPKDGGDVIKQVLDYASYRDLSVGSLAQTHNPLDLALKEDAYFAVQTDEGIKYTRDGGFALNNNRELVNKSGYQVLSDSNGPIVVPPEATSISVTPEGVMSSELGEIGRIKVVAFEHPQEMVNIGQNLYDAAQLQERPVKRGAVIQGAIEESNVNPVIEMNKMVELLRLFEMTQKMLVGDHERIRAAIQKLTKV